MPGENIAEPMPRFMLTHRHRPEECAVVFAAWAGFESPLRRHVTKSSCTSQEAGTAEHCLWWEVDAASAEGALALLPPFVAERTDASEVGEVRIP